MKKIRISNKRLLDIASFAIYALCENEGHSEKIIQECMGLNDEEFEYVKKYGNYEYEEDNYGA